MRADELVGQVVEVGADHLVVAAAEPGQRARVGVGQRDEHVLGRYANLGRGALAQRRDVPVLERDHVGRDDADPRRAVVQDERGRGQLVVDGLRRRGTVAEAPHRYADRRRDHDPGDAGAERRWLAHPLRPDMTMP